MSANLLVLLSDERSAADLLLVAESIANLTGGSTINALSMRLDPHSAALLGDEPPSAVDEEIVRLREVARSGALRRVFTQWAAKEPSAGAMMFTEQVGTSEAILKRWNGNADYILVARPHLFGELAEHEALLASVFASRLPVLIIPNGLRALRGEIIAVAWRGDEVILDVLTNLRNIFPNIKQIHFLVGCFKGEQVAETPRFLPGSKAIVFRYDIHTDQDNFPRMLLEIAREVNADLLVVGASAHSSWHILLFGNVTKTLLHKGDVPLIMHQI